jgi:eukaryotic-like serine/threonine-protein kinase
VEDLARNAKVAVSRSGSLVYTSIDSVTQDGALVWVDRQGSESPIRALESGFINSHLRLSPDNRWVAVVKQGSGHEGIWKYDLAGRGRQQLTKEEGYLPTWHPDGARVAFTRLGQIYGVASQGDSEPQILYQKGSGAKWPSSWSPDGRFLAFQEYPEASAPGSQATLRILHPDGSVSTLLGTAFNEREAEFSPRGNRMAYVSNESGRDEVYLTPYPADDQKRRVSVGRGNHPAWSPLGDELFYQDENRMMAVSVPGAGSLTAGTPRLLFEGQYLAAAVNMRNYDLSRDGQRFLMAKGVGTAKVQLNLVVNWFEELKRLNTPGK